LAIISSTEQVKLLLAALSLDMVNNRSYHYASWIRVIH